MCLWLCRAHGGRERQLPSEYNKLLINVTACHSDTLAHSCVPTHMGCCMQGDSGGPIFTAGSDSNGKDDVQYGLVSFGSGCADANYPGEKSWKEICTLMLERQFGRYHPTSFSTGPLLLDCAHPMRCSPLVGCTYMSESKQEFWQHMTVRVIVLACPGVYTSIAYMRPWITARLKDMGYKVRRSCWLSISSTSGVHCSTNRRLPAAIPRWPM